MSIGGCYVALPKRDLNELLDNNLPFFPYIEENEDKKVFLFSLEQAWDAWRLIFELLEIEGLGSEILDCDLGEICLKVETDFVVENLNELTEQDIIDTIHSDEFQKNDFYWGKFFKSPDEITTFIEQFHNMKDFFNRYNNEDYDIIFYQN